MSGSDERTFTNGLDGFFGRYDHAEVGIGDDAAVVSNRGGSTVIACDPVVVGVHCATDTEPRAVGRKAILRNLSDLAAMGAVPDYAVVSVLLPRDADAEYRDGLFDGLRSAARDHACAVVGGDIGSTPGPCVVTVTVCGHPVGAPLQRSTARVGDAIHVTGPLGGSLRAHRHLEPTPRLAEGQWLARHTDRCAVIDVSDGLALDLWTLLEASGCPGAELDLASLPIHADARAADDPIAAAYGDGEDYELLFTVAADRPLPDGGPLDAAARQPIGRIVDEAGLWLVHPDGRREPLATAGFQHRV